MVPKTKKLHCPGFAATPVIPISMYEIPIGVRDITNGTYAEGVAFQSPGFAAMPRTRVMGQGDMVTPTGLDNRPAFMARSCCATIGTPHPAFVKPRWGLVPCGTVDPGCAAGAATLGFGM